MVFPPQRPQTAIPEAIPEDQNIIQREAQKIRARELLNQLAQKIGGAGTRVRDANLFTQFLSQMDRQAKAQGAPGIEQAVASDPRIRELSPFATNRAPLDLAGKIISPAAEPTIPESVPGMLPQALQPAARTVRNFSSPLGLVTLPMGTARMAAGALIGAAGGATAGRQVGGDTGELVGEIAGGVLGGTPAVQRLAGRGATAVGRGLEEASLRAAPRGTPLPDLPLPPRNVPIGRREDLAFAPNALRIAAGRPLQRGKRALIDRFELEGRIGGLDPQDMEDAGRFVRALPDEAVEKLGSSFLQSASRDIANADILGAGAGGSYSPADALVNIYKDVARFNDTAAIVVHEIAHHLERFVPADKIVKLRRVFEAEKAAIGARAQGQRQYRYFSFEEWFAENIADRAMRDVVAEFDQFGAGARTIFTRLQDTVRGLGVGIRNWLQGRGFNDQAEVVFRDLVQGRYRGERPLTHEIRQLVTGDEGLQGRQAAHAATQPPIGGQPPLTPAQQLEQEVAAARARIPPRQPPQPPTEAVPPGGVPPEGGDRVQVLVDKITGYLKEAPAARLLSVEERRKQIARGAEIGRGRAAEVTDPLAQSRAFISGQSGLRTSQARFEPLGIRVSGPEGAGDLARLSPADSAKALGITDSDFTALHARIAQKLPDQFMAKDGQAALIRMLTGNIPTDRGQRLLEVVFGTEFVKALRSRRSNLGKALEVSNDVLSLLPKTLRSSWDMSAPLRQGVVLTASPFRARQTAQSFADMIRVGFTKGDPTQLATQIYMDAVDPAKNRWAAELYTPGAPRQLFLHDPRGAMIFSPKEEVYASRLAEKLPSLGGDLRSVIRSGSALKVAKSAAALPVRVVGSGVRRSELMYGTYLNQMRNKIATRTLNEWEEVARRGGPKIQAADVDALIDGLNVFTGRGNLGKMEGTVAAKILTATFWSPRLAVSRFQAFGTALRGLTADQVIRVPGVQKQVVERFGLEQVAAGARARRELAKDMVAFVGVGTAILGALKQFDIADVEVDPRSTDFGKGHIGPMRFDFWGGFQSTARFVTQVTLAQTKVISGPQAGRIRIGTPHIGVSGEQVKGEPSATRLSITGRFLRGKLAPGLPTLVWNELAADTFMGEFLNDKTRLFGNTTGPEVTVRQREIIQQFIPLLAIDVTEVAEEMGWGGVLFAVPAGGLGVGVQIHSEEGSSRRPQRSGRDF